MSAKASIPAIAEDDFQALAWAANEAHRQGNSATAQRLDVMARKANAALAHASASLLVVPGFTNGRRQRWQDVPSTLTSRAKASP